jgi:tRNA pseudouridine13 synthase
MSIGLPCDDPLAVLPFAHGGPPLRGRLRVSPEDFIVEEVLGWEPEEAGEHLFLIVRKRGLNTADVALRLARLAGVPPLSVGYAGLKDRHAITTQAFTVHLPGEVVPDWSVLAEEGIEVISVQRHARKLRRGALSGNRFRLCVRDVEGDRTAVDTLLRSLQRLGVPNAFGPQRFGRSGSNLTSADALFAGRIRRPKREQQGLWLSAARAHLFNTVLAERLRRGHWNHAIEGDVLMLAGTHSQFRFDPHDMTLDQRVDVLDVHPTGPLPGRPGRSLAPEAGVAELEQEALNGWAHWVQGLVNLAVDADRRALRLAVQQLQWQWYEDRLELAFELTAGAYATAVLREVVETRGVD